MKNIVILGGGFGGVEFYKTLHKKLHGAPNIGFHLISRWNYFLFYPMLHEVATGSVERSHITQPLREIVSCCLEQFTQAEIKRVDFRGRTVITDRGEIPYDYLIVSLGVKPNYFGIPGVGEHCLPFKSVQDAVAVRNTVIKHFEQASREHDAKKRRHLLSFVVVGGGPTGVELAGQLADLLHNEMAELYQEIDAREISITLVDATDRLLRQMDPALSARALARLHDMGVRVLLNTQVTSCEAHRVCLNNGEAIYGGLRIWAGGTQSALREVVPGEYLTQRGLLKTRNTLQLVGHPEVFVIGDNAEIVEPAPYPTPQTAQYASGQARHAAANMMRLLRHETLKPFTFHSLGDIVPIGDWFAVAQIGKLHIYGRFAWVLRRVVFLKRIWSPMNRIKVLIDWVLHALLRRDTSEL